MITLENITKIYKKRIPTSVQRQIRQWINQPEAQKFIEIALDYSIDKDTSLEIFNLGSFDGKYPRLYWLCCIYIHPLTKLQYLCEKVDKLCNTVG